MSTSFTYFCVNTTEFAWLKAEDHTWVRVRDVEQVIALPHAERGKVSVQIKGKTYWIPHTCSDQAALDTAVYQLLEKAALPGASCIGKR